MLTILFFALSFLFIWMLMKSVLEKRLAIAGRVNSLQSGSSKQTYQRDAEIIEDGFIRRVFQPLWHLVITKVERWSPNGWRAEEQKRLARSGMFTKITTGEWLAWRFVSIAVGLILFSFLALELSGMKQFMVLFIGFGLGWQFPVIYLKQKATKRQKEITRSLPDVLDLLTVSVEAGLGFDAGIAKVVEKTQGALSEEFAKMLQEIRMGKARREALRDMGRRTGNPDLIGFVGAIVQADQLGVSIGNVLRIQSDDLRGRRKARAQEQAMKAPIKILFPLILFIFPSLFIIILGPAVINIKNTFLK
jgi:tight adherence protein C